jgi:hypothetical protein
MGDAGLYIPPEEVSPEEPERLKKSPFSDPVIDSIEKFAKSDDDAKEAVLTAFRHSEFARKQFEYDWEEFYRNWRGRLRVNERYPLLSRSFIPKSHEFVETIVPFIMDGVFDDRAPVFPVPMESADAKDAVIQGQYINHQILNRIELGPKLETSIRGLGIYGTAWLKLLYRCESQADLRENDDAAKSDIYKSFKDGRQKRLRVYDGPDVEPTTVWSVYPDFAFPKPKDMRFLIHRYFTSVSKLKATERDSTGRVILKNLDKAAQSKLPRIDNPFQFRLFEQSRSGHSLETIGQGPWEYEKDPLVEVFDFWTPAWLIRLVNREIVIYNDANPLPIQRIPFIKLTAVDDQDFMYGLGVCEIVRSLQNTANIMLNQRLDNVNLVLNPMWKVRRAGAVNTKQLVSRPGGFIFVNQTDDVTPHLAQDVTSSAIANINDVIRHMENATGILDFFRGQGPDTSRFPATGIALLQRASGRRFTTYIKGVWQGLKELYGMIQDLNAAFADEDDLKRVLGPKAELPDNPKKVLADPFVDLMPVGKAVNGNPEVLLQFLIDIDTRWAASQDVPPQAKLEIKREILRLAQADKVLKLFPQAPETAQAPGATPGGLAEMLMSMQGGAQAEPTIGDSLGIQPPPLELNPPGETMDFLNLPPGTTNPGGLRQMRVMDLPQ